jgi:cell fate regulator YaaT (PSP1 superfamily)
MIARPGRIQENSKMPLVVGVAFRPGTKIYHFDATGFEDLQPGERVIVETSRGRTMGRVALGPRSVANAEISGALKPVVRRATAWDAVQADQMMHKEAEALATCKARADALGMRMKVVKAEYSYDGSSIVVYFTADQRVDFRHLVHDLAQALQTRVEMRQVGVRDEAKFAGGYGRCGRELCCTSWLREFTPVSIKMAKQQDLPLNASEVSGVCGRLLCCLGYENEFYTEARKQMPRLNSMLMTPQGAGKVKQVHVLANSVTVQVEGPGDTRIMVEMPVSEPIFADPAAARPSSRVSSDERIAASPTEDTEGLEDAEEQLAPARRPTPTAVRPTPQGQARPPRGRKRRRPP